MGDDGTRPELLGPQIHCRRDARPLRRGPRERLRVRWCGMRLLGSPPTFLATPAEAVWELAEHRYVYIEELPAALDMR
jgi:hypothetical protein